MLYAFDLIEHDGDDLRIGEPDDACNRTPEGISRRFSLPVRLGDRVRVSFVALKSGHVCRFTFPLLPFATFP